MKTNWEVHRDGETFYVNLGNTWVEVGSHRGSGQTDSAGRCTHAEFLAGRWQDSIRTDMGEQVLAEVIASVIGAA